MTAKRRFASKRQRTILWADQDGLCAICGQDLSDRFEVDHIQPFSKRGNTALWNLQAICIPCHQAKTKVDSSLEKANSDSLSISETTLAQG